MTSTETKSHEKVDMHPIIIKYDDAANTKPTFPKFSEQNYCLVHMHEFAYTAPGVESSMLAKFVVFLLTIYKI